MGWFESIIALTILGTYFRAAGLSEKRSAIEANYARTISPLMMDCQPFKFVHDTEHVGRPLRSTNLQHIEGVDYKTIADCFHFGTEHSLFFKTL